MTPSTSADVLVAGAGPAGAAAALALARRGLTVLLADPGPTGPPYELLVTAPALAALDLLGVPTEWATRLDALELRFGRPLVLSDAGLAVADQRTLRRALRAAAVEAGVREMTGTVASLAWKDGCCHALVTRPDAEPAPVTARHLVIATGAAQQATGEFRAQRCTGADLGPRALLTMAEDGDVPVCVWAVPGSSGMLTVGAARSGTAGPDLLDLARATLAELGPLAPAGPPVHGTLNTGFSPGRTADADGLLVGDTAGLVNPFTGEGLSYALQSALLAADAIAAHPADPQEARSAYADRLTGAFIGYFETARHASRRHRLMWRILTDAAGSDHPFFAKGRRAMLLPEGLAGLVAPEPAPQGEDHGDLLRAGPFLDACSEVAVVTIRREWPFLARLVLTGDTLGHHRLRPARLFLAAMLAGGSPPDTRRATTAAAIELATLGALALLSPPRRAAGPSRGVDWALTSAVVAGDFLLAQASRLVAESAPQVSRSFAEWLAELSTLRAARLDRPEDDAGAVYASLFEYPARIGAVLGGCPERLVQAARDFGHHCGYAFQYAEDVLALGGKRTRLDTSLATMIESGTSAVFEHFPGTTADSAADPELRGPLLKASAEACARRHRSALDALAPVENAASRRMFEHFAAALTAPALGWRHGQRTD
jgi:flavin-dependent dehydrogenase